MLIKISILIKIDRLDPNHFKIYVNIVVIRKSVIQNIVCGDAHVVLCSLDVFEFGDARYKRGGHDNVLGVNSVFVTLFWNLLAEL